MAFTSRCLGEGIIYIPDHDVLFCTRHQSAIPLVELKYHLRINRDHKLPPEKWQPIVKAAEVIRPRLKNTVVELDILDNDSEPLPFLPVLDGTRCLKCHYVRGTRKDDRILKAHFEKNHSIGTNEKWQDCVEEVLVQRWVSDTRGTYWVVNANQSTSVPSKTPHELVLEALEVEEEMDREEETKRNQQEDDAKGLDESTPWLKHHTKWPKRFKDRPLNILAITKKPPAFSPNSRPNGLTAGKCGGIPVRWDGKFEERLHAIMVSLRQMFERCLSTLDSTETQVACWIHSINDSYYPKEFKRCQRRGSLEKYFLTWRQLICYLFRVHHFDEPDRHKIYGQVYSEEMAERLTAAWELTDKERSNTTPDALAVQLFDISIHLLTTPQSGGSYTNCTMMHFVGVLGIDEKTHFWKSPCVFTTILAGLVWMSRLLFLEYALPERAYHGLSGADSPEASRADFPIPLDRLHYIRRKYVRRGSPYALDAIFELLFKGNELRMREGGKVKVTWRTTEEPDDTLVLETPKKSMTLMMKDFHQMRVDAVLAAENMVKHLMYGLEPSINLDQIHDNLANWNVGYSFMTDEHNNLQKAFHALRTAATSAEGSRCLMNRKFQYRVRRCQDYLRHVDILVQRLFGAVHLTFGLPGRGTEINLVTWVNTREHIRNIYVRHGTILIMTDNSKLRGSTGKPFWVVRAVPKCVARPLFLYLAYIRPFADSLQKLLEPEDSERNAYLYVSYYSSRRHFNATDGSSALYSLTETSSMPMKIGIYRQASIAIGKKHVENTVKNLNPWEPSSMVEQINAWQCTHSVHTHRNSYARLSGMPTGLTEDLIMRYLYNSIRWHIFGDLEKMVELGRDLQVEGKGVGGPKRALKELDINVVAGKRTKIDSGHHVRVCSGNTSLWEEKLAQCTEKGYQHLDEFWQDYQPEGETGCVGEAQESLRISLKSFNTCMNFIGRLTSGENIERVMGLIRVARLRSGTDVPELTPGESLTGSIDDPTAALFSGLLEVYQVQPQRPNAYVYRNVLMSKVAEQILPSSAIFDTDTLLDGRHQEILLDLIPEEFGEWSLIHWHALAQNFHQWVTMIQHTKWKESSTFGLGLLLPMNWEWNVEYYLAEVNMATWSWFVDRLHLICPNLHKLACVLNDYGRAIIGLQTLPPLLEMEIQSTTDLNMLATEEVGCRVSIEAGETRRIVKFYEYLARRPSNWQRTIQLAQQHI